MKKILSTILTVLCMTAMVCCSNESVVTGNESTTTTTTGINYNLCKMTAETQIMRTAQYDEKWEGAKITNHYYWYNPMIEDAPAYIEFKVTKDGQDAGYVMVSTTEQDFEVPEYSTEGKTMYECLQNQANSTNITATRFNSFDYMAEVNGGRGESKRVFFGDIAYMNNSEGGRGCSDYDEYIAQYKAFRNKIGGIGGCKAELANYYKLKEDANQHNNGRGNVTPPYSATISTSIDRKDLMPKYAQYKKPNHFNHAGCGPVSAAMLLGYWYHFHDKTNLFPNTPALSFDWSSRWYDTDNVNSNEKSVIELLGSSKYMNTTYYEDRGSTDPYYKWRGLYKYIQDKGYNHWVIRHYWVDDNQYTWRNPDITLEWNGIYDEIKANRPALLGYYDHEISNPGNHSAVIYSVRFDRDQWTAKVYTVYCSIYTGWSPNNTDEKVVNTSSFTFNEVQTCKIW